MREALARAEGGRRVSPFLPLDLTVGQALDSVDEAWDAGSSRSGTPTQVADAIERWLDDDGIDGINLRQYHSFDTRPGLRRAGRAGAAASRADARGVRAGETLRERLFGEGPRLPERHPAARYRGGENL